MSALSVVLPEGVLGSDVRLQLRRVLLGSAIDDLVEDLANSQPEIEAIGVLNSTILAEVRGPGQSEFENDIADLHKAIGATIELLKACETGRSRSAELATVSGESLADLSQCLLGLSDIVHRSGLVSLNAAVSCVRLGTAGAPLTLIAKQVRELNHEILLHSRSISDLIERTEHEFDQFSRHRGQGEFELDSFADVFTSALSALAKSGKEVSVLQELMPQIGKTVIAQFVYCEII